MVAYESDEGGGGFADVLPEPVVTAAAATTQAPAGWSAAQYLANYPDIGAYAEANGLDPSAFALEHYVTQGGPYEGRVFTAPAATPTAAPTPAPTAAPTPAPTSAPTSGATYDAEWNRKVKLYADAGNWLDLARMYTADGRSIPVLSGIYNQVMGTNYAAADTQAWYDQWGPNGQIATASNDSWNSDFANYFDSYFTDPNMAMMGSMFGVGDTGVTQHNNWINSINQAITETGLTGFEFTDSLMRGLNTLPGKPGLDEVGSMGAETLKALASIGAVAAGRPAIAYNKDLAATQSQTLLDNLTGARAARHQDYESEGMLSGFLKDIVKPVTVAVITYLTGGFGSALGEATVAEIAGPAMESGAMGTTAATSTAAGTGLIDAGTGQVALDAGATIGANTGLAVAESSFADTFLSNLAAQFSDPTKIALNVAKGALRQAVMEGKVDLSTLLQGAVVGGITGAFGTSIKELAGELLPAGTPGAITTGVASGATSAAATLATGGTVTDALKTGLINGTLDAVGTTAGNAVATLDLGGANSIVDRLSASVTNQVLRDIALTGGQNITGILANAGFTGAYESYIRPIETAMKERFAPEIDALRNFFTGTQPPAPVEDAVFTPVEPPTVTVEPAPGLIASTQPEVTQADIDAIRARIDSREITMDQGIAELHGLNNAASGGAYDAMLETLGGDNLGLDSGVIGARGASGGTGTTTTEPPVTQPPAPVEDAVFTPVEPPVTEEPPVAGGTPEEPLIDPNAPPSPLPPGTEIPPPDDLPEVPDITLPPEEPIGPTTPLTPAPIIPLEPKKKPVVVPAAKAPIDVSEVSFGDALYSFRDARGNREDMNWEAGRVAGLISSGRI